MCIINPFHLGGYEDKKGEKVRRGVLCHEKHNFVQVEGRGTSTSGDLRPRPGDGDVGSRSDPPEFTENVGLPTTYLGCSRYGVRFRFNRIIVPPLRPVLPFPFNLGPPVVQNTDDPSVLGTLSNGTRLRESLLCLTL